MTESPVTTELRPGLNEIDQMIEANQCSPLSNLINSIFGRAEQPSRRSILFTAAESKAGVSWMASAVAAEMAAAGRKVLLADAEVVASFSIADAVISRCHRVGSGRIWVLGREQMAYAEYLLQPAHGQLEANLRELGREYPYIVVDAPAVSVSDVAVWLAPLVMGSVLVVRERKTETRELVKACGLLSSSGGNILGCVYNVH